MVTSSPRLKAASRAPAQKLTGKQNYASSVDISDVVQLYRSLADHDIPVWIDGGWCVDALVGTTTRDHDDLDVAVDRIHAAALRSFLVDLGFAPLQRPDETEWMYVLTNDAGDQIDVHVFQYDDAGNVIYGVEYPNGSLTGQGALNGESVDCVSAEWMFRFKTSYQPKAKDKADVAVLAKAFGFTVPSSHQ